MKVSAKKMAVLQILRDRAGPSSIRDVLEELGQDYSERSLRRWLSEMIRDGLVEKIGKKRATKYQAGLLASHATEGQIKTFSVESSQVLAKVHRPLYERTPVDYAEQWVDSYVPNQTFYLPEEVRENLYDAGQRSQNKDPAGTYARQIFQRLLIDLSYNSSRLEGNTYSFLDTQRLILEGTSVEGKLDEERIMILNHKEAIRYLVENSHRLRITTETICTLHYLLSDALVDPKNTGKIRDHAVRIGGSVYIPYEDPRKLQLQLTRIVDVADQITNPFEQSLFLLVHISYLQAFADINKRTARLSANIPFVIHNLVPLSFNDIDRDDYVSSVIAVYELQDIRPLRDLFVYSYFRSCLIYDSTVQTVGFDEVRVRYRLQRRRIVGDVIVQKLIGKELEIFVSDQARKLIPKEARNDFIQDVFEDLEFMDPSRSVGLGITQAQVEKWMKMRENHGGISRD